jgi:hypothetical protein
VNTTGTVVVAALAAAMVLPPPVAAMTDLAIHQIGRERGQLIVLVVREAVFDRDIAAFDEACLIEPAAECFGQIRTLVLRQARQVADHRNGRLLGARRYRPGRGTAQHAEKRSPLHLRP